MKQPRIYNRFVLFVYLSASLLYIPGMRAEQIKHHAIVVANQEPTSQEEHRAFNQALQIALQDLDAQVQQRAHGPVFNSPHYPHKKNIVFPVRYDHYFGHCTLHIPSYISYNDFVQLAQQVFAKHQLALSIEKDFSISVASSSQPLQNSETGLEGQSLTLRELDEYSKYTTERDFNASIARLEEKSLAHPSTANEHEEKIALLKKLKTMRPYFFWHVENPTVGMSATSNLNIPKGFEPISWKFSLWDLAPLQGKGITIGIIDTGLAGFKIENEPAAKQNINVVMPNAFGSYGYNLVADDGLNPFEQFAFLIEKYCDASSFDYQELLDTLPAMILNFLKTKDFSSLETYLIAHMKSEYLTSATRLNSAGKAVLKKLLYGPEGLLPQNNEHQSFHIAQIEAPYQATVIKEAIPYPKVSAEESTFVAGHGTFTACLVAGRQFNGKGVFGIAPQAELLMIKAFNDEGVTNKSTLISALELALLVKTDVVGMSLKVTDSLNFKDETDITLRRMIDAHDYVIAASGNNGDPQLPEYAGKKEAYPARFESVAFDVGSFSYSKGQYPVCSFTQMEPKIGPKFVAPGFNILSAGLVPNQTEESMYVFMDGTSVSVPIITGYVALVLAEFKDTFTKEQILSVMYKCSIRLNDSVDWQQNILLGACDMRSALLCLRVLEAIKKDLIQKKVTLQLPSNKTAAHATSSIKDTTTPASFVFEEKFNQLVEAICTIMFYIPLEYGKKTGISLNKNMVGYAQIVVDKEFTPEAYFSIKPGSSGVLQAVEFIKRYIYHVLGSSAYADDMHHDLVTSISKILTKPQINLFAHLPDAVQTRLHTSITFSAAHKDSFWKKQAAQLKA